MRMMKLKAVLSFVLCMALLAGMSVMPAGAAVSAVTITFDTEGGTPVMPITQDEGTPVILPANPTKTGYIFAGWDPAVPVIMPEDDMTCVAQWEALVGIPTSITFDTEGGSPVDPITQDEGTPVTPPADPTRAGYTFMGWEPPIPATFPVYDMCCVAQWEPYTSTITFDSDGGTPVASIVVHPDDLMIHPPDPTREGYTFMGWEPPVPATFPEDDMTCVAQWEPIEYFIILDPNGGKWEDGSSEPREFHYVDGILVPPGWDEGTPVMPPEDPSREGYSFQGWMPEIPSTSPQEDYTCYAQWELIPNPTSTITFDSASGSAVEPITQDEGTTVTAPADPTRVGYIFAGWSPAVPASMPLDDMTCAAQWNLIGDLNNNSSITAIDALMALQGSTGTYVLSALQRLAADANHDGRISAIDALMLLQAASGKITLS